ncbi:hypothetical protein [Helicobacter pylori]|uniref:hypothetical protein n=1 Tax=Helicobacter pylori TaxID=210 RepID=UPI0013E35FE5|nr:hypothetical protein [Helicobacter pylori]MCG3025882.1 hypothetical protein [Helicobacter pylori]
MKPPPKLNPPNLLGSAFKKLSLACANSLALIVKNTKNIFYHHAQLEQSKNNKWVGKMQADDTPLGDTTMKIIFIAIVLVVILTLPLD